MSETFPHQSTITRVIFIGKREIILFCIAALTRSDKLIATREVLWLRMPPLLNGSCVFYFSSILTLRFVSFLCRCFHFCSNSRAVSETSTENQMRQVRSWEAKCLSHVHRHCKHCCHGYCAVCSVLAKYPFNVDIVVFSSRRETTCTCADGKLKYLPRNLYVYWGCLHRKYWELSLRRNRIATVTLICHLLYSDRNHFIMIRRQ